MPKRPKQADTDTADADPMRRPHHANGGGNAAIDAATVATLGDLRKATGHTQEDLAIALGVGQGTVSRIEKRNDMLVSTLQHYIESVGGALQIMATFPNRPPLLIERLGKKAATQHNGILVKPPGPSRRPNP